MFLDDEELKEKVRRHFRESEEQLAEQDRQKKIQALNHQLGETRHEIYSILNSMESNSFYAFLRSRGYIMLDTRGKITSQHLYTLYQKWCEDASVTPQMPRSLWSYIKLSGEYYGIRPGYLMGPKGKRVRGFVGLRDCTPEEAASPDPRYRFRGELERLKEKKAQLEASLKECNTYRKL